jgi:hypothetical protein
MIYNILGEQYNCYITQKVYLVPPIIYNIKLNSLCDVTAILLPKNVVDHGWH